MPSQKTEDWLFSAPSHLQVIREETNINALPKNRRLAVFRSKSPPSYSRGNQHQCPPKKQKIGCFPLQVTSKLFERKPTSMPSQKRGNLGVFRSKSPSSYSRGSQHQFPPKKEVTWVFSAPSHLQVIREIKSLTSLPKNGEARWRRRQC